MPEMMGMDIRGFDAKTFEAFMLGEVKQKLASSKWGVLSATLHNTGKMVWPGIVKGKSITPQQRIRNMSVDWVSRGFRGGVHVIVGTDGSIWTCWPMWKPGTHSPSFNPTHWSVEVVGDFRTEIPSPVQKAAVLAVLSAMAKTIGPWRFLKYFKFHKEDPRTSHKSCPGINLGTKEYWLSAIRAKLGGAAPAAGLATLMDMNQSDSLLYVYDAENSGDHEPTNETERKEENTMDFTSMFKFNSKTFWLGVGMVLAGAYKMSGIDIPVIPELEILADIAPESGATLIKAGMLSVFLRDALPSK